MSYRTNVMLMVLGLSLLSAQAVLAGFTSGPVQIPADVQQGSGPDWLAEDTGSATSTTIGAATFLAESHFSTYTLAGSLGPSFADPGLDALMDNARRTSPPSVLTMSDSLTVTSGRTYTLQLLFWDPVNAAPSYRLMDISVTNGATTETLSAFSVVGAAGGFSTSTGAYVNYGFTAASSTITVSLTKNTDTSDEVAFLSGFSLLAVPEPASISVALCGSMALVGCTRRRYLSRRS